MQTQNVELPNPNWPEDEYPQVGPYMTIEDVRNLVDCGALIPNEDALVCGVIIVNGFLKQIHLGHADPRNEEQKKMHPVIAYAVYNK